MAKLTIRLVQNPATGRREVDVAYESDADALPHEHEEDHRKLVEKIVGSLRSGAIEVERGGTGALVDLEAEEQAAAREKLRQ